jgi:hypothetical protein
MGNKSLGSSGTLGTLEGARDKLNLRGLQSIWLVGTNLLIYIEVDTTPRICYTIKVVNLLTNLALCRVKKEQ